MILVAVVYGGCGFVGINLTPEKDISIRETMGKAYNVTPEEIHYVAVEYFVRDENDERVLNYLSIGTAIMLNTIFTLTPMILIFIPCIIFYILPIFEIPLGVDANILSISLILYPMIDPIGVLFVIRPYRMFIKKFFRRQVMNCTHKTKNKNDNIVPPVEDFPRFHSIAN
ncbi:hypothetical protein GCK72_014704 [Caenorhabditis remanei]|uniref:Uncharacterized protein n=1 Tax=Caenorhabditis remanei TaxID=31234 RepID=A0A6A5GUG7_CAERE|nr:hypothetical protein GCK72_014704 [Caenorhabditis remanei]KAF1758246.1 hypothetical protein GCK72_014704 [Caenorhabditis remanei]